VIIFAGLGDFRNWDHYKNWAKLAASQGFIGVVYAAKQNAHIRSFTEILDFVIKENTAYFIDTARIAMYAGSGNVSFALPAANSDKRIRAALIYYGTAKIDSFRPDLPVYIIRAGLDNIALNKGLDTVVFRALQANAPYTVFNYNTALHAFEGDTDDSEVIGIMKGSLGFLKTNLSEAAQNKYYTKRFEVLAVKQLYKSNFQEALEAYKKVILADTSNNEAERQLGNISIELKEYRNAITYYNNSLAHGNWRKGEIAVKKILAFAKLGNADAAVNEMRFLKKIGWFKESDYIGNKEYSTLVQSEVFRRFSKE
jgi:tetratricopeptide (TPR) repeat protein